MRYHYENSGDNVPKHGEVYICNHSVYDRCTLFKVGNLGLAVIQQKHDEAKRTWWEEIDPGLANDIYKHPAFPKYFVNRAKEPVNDIYPTVTVRQLMWALKMKPLLKNDWETVFDRKNV